MFFQKLCIFCFVASALDLSMTSTFAHSRTLERASVRCLNANGKAHGRVCHVGVGR